MTVNDTNIMPLNIRCDTRWLSPKAQNRNLVTVVFHMITITLISMSLVQLRWFTIAGDVCTPFLTLNQFFWFGYSSDELQNPEYACVDSTIVNLMRTIILLCFMAIIFSLGGFFLIVIAPKNNVYRFIQRYALPNMCTVLWIMAIISICYYVVVLLEESLRKLFPEAKNILVSYGYGFYSVTLAGGIASIGTFCTLIMMHTAPEQCSNDERCLLNSEDSLDTFNSPTPPPPYSIPPPPYAP